ncbi:hypothetical protein [Rufibacter tibetensis]|uniref:Lipoprotein n=1 Tax=Rufibacter tibetensis TaxID=512763 RepID=A0A0P0CZZ8_9BACT|nr:hypothetical protein [Rufibacter tibetensis]ALJ01070.1 hypothetical protein DC20_21320 [Rufibacter tibetensis]
MNRFLYICLLGLVSCSPEKSAEEISTAPAASANSPVLEQVADSVSNTREDGTATASSPPIDIKQQLPAELEVHLDRTHGLWQFPTLTDADVQRIPQEEQGPYFVQADFNGDKQQDYAIQLMERDSAFVYAFVKEKDNEFKEYLLERNKLLDVAAKKRSIRYLRLASKQAKYYDYGTRKNIKIPYDGVSVGAENYTATYVWDNGKFRKYETGD